MNTEQVDERRESYDWSALAGELGWDEVRRRFNQIATARGEWAGVPVPVADIRVVVANDRQAFAPIWPRGLPSEGIEAVNSWGVSRAFRVFIFNLDNERVGYCQNYWAARLDALFDTIRARRAVLPDAEMKGEWVLSHTHEICHAWPCLISACGSICSFGSSCGFRGGIA
jgi:hypothetical protein